MDVWHGALYLVAPGRIDCGSCFQQGRGLGLSNVSPKGINPAADNLEGVQAAEGQAWPSAVCE